MRALIIASFMFAASAQAGELSLCAERETLIESLLNHYGEKRVFGGLKIDGIMMELFASPDGTWTEIWTWPNGTSCVMQDGRSHDINVAGGDT